MNKGKRWTNDENNILIDYILNNNINLLDNISIQLGRTKYAIIKQLEKLLFQQNININEIYEDVLISNIKKSFPISNIKKSFPKDNSNLINSNIIPIIDDIINEIEDTSNLNQEQLICYQYIKQNKNVFITGSGGTGKSTVLKSIIKYLNRQNKNIGITSSTGLSATLINGTTLHSFLNIGISKKSANELYEKIKLNTKIYNKLKNLEVLIIDEISMIDDILFNKIAAYLSLIKEIKKPFGKIQLILCGDFYQLPPIENTYCFNSKIWDKLNIKTILLTKQMRQLYDQEFQYILEQIKINNITDEIYSKLLELKNSSSNNSMTTIIPTILYSKNIDIDKINEDQFINLINLTNNPVFEFPILFDNSNSKIKSFLKKNPYYVKSIKLCLGLQIMITTNIKVSSGITNGTRGIIININDMQITIQTLNNMIFNIEYITYQNELDQDIIFKYIPLKLAYAITIHKSQGQTLDYIQINLGKDIFDYGMAYVALSRAKSLNSIILTDLSRSAFKTNPKVIEFYKKNLN